ncbi:MAG TPA: class I SAM-dependent methyltransferase [Polyangiaceae bacterium]
MARYGKLCAEFYDLDHPEAPPDALEFYREFARRAVGPVLEPMCGSGRFLIPLLLEGFDVEGVDASAEMRAACEERGRAVGVSPVVRCGSIEAFEPSRQFGLVFIPSGSFCLLTDEQTVKLSLQRIHSALLRGGTFVVEVERVRRLPPQGTGVWNGRWVHRSDGAKIVLSVLSEYSGVQQMLRSVHRYDLVQEGKLLATEYEDFDLKLYEPGEFGDQLHAAGFTNIEAWRPYEPTTPGDEDDAVVFSCTK